MTLELHEFDTSTYLDNEEVIAEYLSQVLADGDPDELLVAIGNIAKARGMTKIANDSGLGRESLYKVFAPGAKPRFETVMKVMRALGVELQAKPAGSGKSH
ncbi:putative addiction module antidote protein [Pseudomonas sp. LA21]|uniref:addiction module antidote protein n=1 Tax=unclassified Pseudomonas TaxID=196821 RepID=UPI001FB5FC65|nr:addiction module antidote protein [Pseudomonas sp. LA21]MCJ1885069.1 putative addiction module antidote protein [Pseudomonas sp. LA21]